MELKNNSENKINFEPQYIDNKNDNSFGIEHSQFQKEQDLNNFNSYSGVNLNDENSFNESKNLFINDSKKNAVGSNINSKKYSNFKVVDERSIENVWINESKRILNDSNKTPYQKNNEYNELSAAYKEKFYNYIKEINANE